MNRKMILMSVIVLTGLAVLVAGCGMNREDFTSSDEETLVEVTVSSMVAKTIEPSVVMDIKSYDLVYGISGSATVKTKPGIAAVTGTTTVYLLLSAGTYDFTINGYNGTDPFAIGQGSAKNIKVSPKKQTPPISITVSPITGTGGVNITVDWSAWAARTGYVFNNPSLEASVFAWNANLATDNALQIVLTPTVGTTSASLAGTNIDNGYYKCRIQFKENGTPIVSTVDALRVVSNYTSVETYTLDHQLDGLAVLEVKKDLQNPLAVDFYIVVNGNPGVDYADNPSGTPLPDFFPVVNGTDISVKVSPKKDGAATPVDGFEWYMDGDGPLANSGQFLGSEADPASYSYFIGGNGFDIGSHTLSVLVTKGTTVSSRSVQFIIQEP